MKKGFTLIEMVVAIGVTSIIVVVMTSIMLNSFQAKTRVNLADMVERNGNFVIAEVRKNIINSVSAAMICPVGVGLSLSLVGRDGLASQLVCEDGVKIASESAYGSISLLDGQVTVSCADSFVSCSLGGDGLVEQVNIGFTLSAGQELAGPKAFVEKSFTSKVSVRD